jgi:hypothetical protein
MISGEAEYPELERKIKLVPKDAWLAVDPYVCRYLDKLAEAMQPVADEAMVELCKDLLVYGTTRQPIEAYVYDVLHGQQLRRELKAREELWSRLYREHLPSGKG